MHCSKPHLSGFVYACLLSCKLLPGFCRSLALSRQLTVQLRPLAVQLLHLLVLLLLGGAHTLHMLRLEACAQQAKSS